ncbi:MAG: hypothetical protein Q8941_05735 [Bacteroidota bacterium]|nr:hypothetical protein [Bacteroidota bacterium]
MQKRGETDSLVHWTYSRDEWKTFMRWKKMREGFFHYLLYRLSPNRKSKIPEITITHDQVCMDDIPEPFDDQGRRFTRINIHDAGIINVMEISYRRHGIQHAGLGEIHIPVPKGRLKEAIGVEEKLNTIKH